MGVKKLLFCLSLLLLFQSALYAQNADTDLLRKINLNRNTSLDPMFRAFSNSVTPVCIGLPLTMFTVSAISKDSALMRQSIYAAASFVTASAITTILKYTVDRPRPFVTYPDIEQAASAGSPSFPSGHTSAAFSIATSISIVYPKWYVITPSFLWAGTVGYSRMDLGVHYPSDVLAGALIGMGSAWLCDKINKKLR